MDNIKITTIKYDFIDPTQIDNPLGAFAPACRGSNQLIIYTDKNPYKTTKGFSGVNPYGFEASINKNGVVTSLSDRVKHLKDGYILSGHGNAHRFIQNNISLGSEITIDYDKKLIKVTTDKFKCLFIEFKANKKAALSKYNQAIKKGYIIDKNRINYLFEQIEKIQNQIKLLLSKKHILENKFLYYINKSKKLFKNIYLLSSESKTIASRNVWHRPYEQNLDEILNTLNLCNKLNINGIYLESFFNGDIPGISSITDTNDEVKNGYYGPLYKNDYLYAFISEAHKQNIEVHAWVECYFVGEKSNQWKQTYKDSWHMVNYDGSFIQGNNPEGNEKDFVFLDPANPECMEYVLSIYKELLTKYAFDGINVDYIRYPHGNLNIEYSNGYSEYAINEFKKQNKLDGNIKELVKNPSINLKWIEYRCNKITLLMQKVRELVNEVKPNCLLSTAVCSEIDFAIKNKMQDWKVWAKKGWLDLTFPMAYYEGCSEVANATKELCSFNKENAFSYTGIMCMGKNLPADLVVKQINTLFENDADGYNLFSLSDIIQRKDVQYTLKTSVNRNKSIHPHSNINILLKAFVKDIRKRKPYIDCDLEVELVTNYIKKLNKASTTFDDAIKKLMYLKTVISNKNIKFELARLIRFLNVNNNIEKRK